MDKEYKTIGIYSNNKPDSLILTGLLLKIVDSTINLHDDRLCKYPIVCIYNKKHKLKESDLIIYNNSIHIVNKELLIINTENEIKLLLFSLNNHINTKVTDKKITEIAKYIKNLINLHNWDL